MATGIQKIRSLIIELDLQSRKNALQGIAERIAARRGSEISYDQLYGTTYEAYCDVGNELVDAGFAVWADGERDFTLTDKGREYFLGETGTK